jgi:hypothetical protein
VQSETAIARAEFRRLHDYLKYTLHELPAGVLYGTNGATEKECAALMSDTYRLEKLAQTLGVDIADFISKCRWHYERYPHYLGRRRHFDSYEAYMLKYDAPEAVSVPNNSLQRR